MNLHPFTFVPFGPDPERLPIRWPQLPGHDSYHADLYSGSFGCVATTLAPLCIKAHFRELQAAGKPAWIPGCTWKGLIRNAAEMLGAGCTHYYLYDEVDQRGRRRQKQPPRTPFLPCGNHAACLVCRVFGYSPTRKRDEEEEGGWAGKVKFADSAPAPGARWEQLADGTARLGAFNARHSAFYAPGGNPAGWKIYRHAQNVTGADWRYRQDAWCVPAGTPFPFAVEFLNLTAEEMALFRFALSLEHQCSEHTKPIRLAHKLGFGKALGLGSCEIRVDSVEWANPRRYLFGTQQPPREAGGPCVLGRYLDTSHFRDVMAPCLDFSHAAEEVEFPGREWFDEHRRDSIGQFEEWMRERDRPAAPAVPPPPIVVETPSTPPPPPPALTPGTRVQVEITGSTKRHSLCRAVVAGETWEGKLERTNILREGMLFRVKVDSVDTIRKEFKASHPMVVPR